MKRLLMAAVAFTAFALAVPHASFAFCAAYQPATSDRGRQTIREERTIAWGTIDSTAPKDAHGKYSFFLQVNHYYKGHAGPRIEVTDYGNYQFTDDPHKPGSSKAGTASFLKKYAGQHALVSLAIEDTRRYAGQFQTSECKYSAYGDKDTAALLAIVRSIFAAPTPGASASAKPAPSASAAPSQSTAPQASAGKKASSRSGTIARAAALLAIVGGGIAFFGKGSLYAKRA